MRSWEFSVCASNTRGMELGVSCVRVGFVPTPSAAVAERLRILEIVQQEDLREERVRRAAFIHEEENR